MLQDIAVLTGGEFISEDLGIKLENLETSQLGKAKKVVVDKDNTTIIEGAGKKKDIKARMRSDPQADRKTTSDYDREKLQERLAKLTGGVAVINVGGATETEMKERKDLVDDAVHATRAAAEEGVVPGGGRRAAPRDRGRRESRGPRPGRREDRLRHRRQGPGNARAQIVDNTGEDGDVVVAEASGSRATYGYNAATGEYVDMVKAGIIDPAKVSPHRPAAERRLGRRPHAHDRT
jgi:chaperonin GroEL